MRASIAVLVLLSLAGCRSAPESIPERTDGLEVIVAVDRTEIGPSETMVVSVTIQNSTGRAISFRGSSSCMVGFYIREGAADIGANHILCTSDISTVSFHPGQTVRRFTWSGEDPRSPFTGRVEPGVYTLSGYVGGVGGRMSRPVEVRVVP